MVTAIGSFLGTLIQVDDRNFDGSMRMFYRVRVAIDVAKPLKKQMKLKKDNGDWAFIDFKYERLPTFCFLCGVIGHGDKFCPKDVDVTAGKPYGAWMRAGSRRGVPTMGQRWIPPQTTAERKKWNSPVMESVVDAQTCDDGDTGTEAVTAPGAIVKTVSNAIIPEVVLNDQKRKRTECGIPRNDQSVGDTTSVEGEFSAMECETSGSKNGVVAGLAEQARLES